MKLFLAPMQGMTIANYRNQHHKLFGGFDEYHAPFVSTSDVRKVGKPLFKDILPENNDPETHLVPQLLSNNGKDFRYYANLITEFGYKEINFNVGCPFPTVTKKKKGSGLLQYPELLKDILDEATKDDHYDLTVKMRLGYNELSEGLEVMKLLNTYDLKGVTIHGRTGIQKYTGTVDLDAFETLYQACDHKVTYNGDIFTVEDYKRIQDRFPDIDQFMLGRGALTDPFLASEIKGATYAPELKMNMLTDFHESIFHYFKETLSGDKHICDKMKEFWMHMSVNVDHDGKFYKKIKKCRHVNDYLAIVHQQLKNGHWHKV